jgi:hypothetical protein
MGFAWNWSRDQFWQDFGYPSASPYSGGKLIITSAEHRYDVTNPGSDPGSRTTRSALRRLPASAGSVGAELRPRLKRRPDLARRLDQREQQLLLHLRRPRGGNEYGVEIHSPYYDTDTCNLWKGGSGWTGTC